MSTEHTPPSAVEPPAPPPTPHLSTVDRLRVENPALASMFYARHEREIRAERAALSAHLNPPPPPAPPPPPVASPEDAAALAQWRSLRDRDPVRAAMFRNHYSNAILRGERAEKGAR